MVHLKSNDGLLPNGMSDVDEKSATDLPEPEVTLEVEDDETKAVFKAINRPLLYKIGDVPPMSLTLFFGIQSHISLIWAAITTGYFMSLLALCSTRSEGDKQTLLSIVESLVVPYLVADAVCASGDTGIITKLVSTTMVLNGMTTFCQTVLGVRLPLFQGPAVPYIIPLLSLNELEPTRCNLPSVYPDMYQNGTFISNSTTQSALQDQLVSIRMQELMGPLILCGALHFLTGFTGLVGIVMRFVGPVTIVPTLILIGLYVVKPTIKYVQTNWAIALLTWAISLTLSLYLGSRPMPIPIYKRKKGFKIIRYPLHQVFALLISIIIGWVICWILTATGQLTNDPDSIYYRARTDSRSEILTESAWVSFPYPGQFGAPRFAVSALIGFLIATFTSILDSIGDYYACAGICRVPPPPSHAVNRGIAVEGFCTMISAVMGAGHATTTYGGNIGAIGMTKVASRRVFVTLSIIYLIFGVFNKVSAIFVSIPYPVLGGTILTIMSVFVGVNMSHLKVVNLSSTRNLSIMGFGIFIGYLIPTWVGQNPDMQYTGNKDIDDIIEVILGNPNFVGTILACFLDNTIPGTAEERGISAWQNTDGATSESGVQTDYMEGPEVYEPVLPRKMKNSRVLKYLPIFPYKETTENSS